MAKGRVERVDFYSEYGVTLDVAGARHYCTPPLTRNDPIISAAHYVGACRRLARKLGLNLGPGKQDGIGYGDTLAFGYGRQSPRRWLLEGGYESYRRYEVAAMGRPDRGGNSPYNNVAVPFAYDLRLSARVVNKWNMLHGWGVAPLRPIGIFRLLAAGPSARDIGRGLCRRRKQAHRIVRALYRVSIRGPRGLQYTDERDASSHWRRETSPDGHVYQTAIEWSPRVLEYFGRMSPELQAAAVHHTLAVLPSDVRIVMPRHLPWEAIGRAHRGMVASPRVRIAWATGARLERLAEGISLAPAYPRIPLDLAARICRGESPVQVSGGVLTRREAHEWLLAGTTSSALEWLCGYLPGQTPLRDAAVARWARTVHERGQWEQLTRDRKIAGPHGQRLSVRFIDRVDEIMSEDLIDGPSTSVVAAFEHAAQRAGEAYQNRLLGDHRTISRLPAGWHLYRRCMRLLATPAQLAEEGREQGHCVGTYVSAVESGNSIILALNVLGHRSTAELSRDGYVRQHYAAGNSMPHPLCERVLARFRKRIQYAQRT